MKPFSPSCEQNQEPILAVLTEVFADCRCVLEIGSGTGQHAVYFAARLPKLTWQTSDLPENHAGILAWIDEARLPNVRPPLPLDVRESSWPSGAFDAVFSANAVHIMGWPAVEKMFDGVGRVLGPGGLLCLYGPFHYGGKPTSESNARFDAWLRSENLESGVRDFEALEALAGAKGLSLWKDVAMPANNRTLVWRRD